MPKKHSNVPREARHEEPKFGQGQVGLFDDLVNRVDIGMTRLPPARQGAVLMDQMLAGGLHGRDRAVFAVARSINCRAHRLGSAEQ